MSSDVRRCALGAAVTLVATISCGTIQAVSHDSKDAWFPGVNHDLASLGHVDEDAKTPTDPISAGCTALCFGVPAVIEGALQIADLPFSFLADLVVMPFWSPAEPVPPNPAPEPAPSPEEHPRIPDEPATGKRSARPE